MLTLIILTPFIVSGQNTLNVQVSICKTCRGVNIFDSDKISGNKYTIETSKSKNGLKTKTIYAPYKLLLDSVLIAAGTTDSGGNFEINNLANETYQISIYINRFLKKDTTIIINKKKNKVEIQLDDRKFWNYADSIQMARLPFNVQMAQQDISNGEIRILTYGLSFLSVQESDLVTEKYGFKYFPVAGCVIDGYLKMAIASYNQVVYNYLDTINEHGWRNAVRTDLKNFFINSRTKNRSN